MPQTKRAGDCPEGGSACQTEKVHTEEFSDSMEVTYICNEHVLQWTEHFKYSHHQIDMDERE
jgi:hypothetical protein